MITYNSFALSDIQLFYTICERKTMVSEVTIVLLSDILAYSSLCVCKTMVSEVTIVLRSAVLAHYVSAKL